LQFPPQLAGNFSGSQLAGRFGFSVTASGINFVSSAQAGSHQQRLRFCRFADGLTVELGHLEKPLQLHISLSPDGKWLVWAQLDSAVDDLMLVEKSPLSPPSVPPSGMSTQVTCGRSP
jgi:hypothetical protein